MIVVNTLWDDFLFQQVSECRQNIRIATPGLSTLHVKEILKAKRNDVALEVATGFGLREFYEGKTDLDAVETLVRGKSNITGVPGLEAIFAVFDHERAFVSSGNLTLDGPTSQKSYNVLIDNPYVSKQLSSDFDLLVNSGSAQLFSINVIEEYRDLVYQWKNKEKGKYSEVTETLPTVTELLDTVNLRGWTLDVFQAVLNTKTTTFDLDQVYEYTGILQAKHPFNNHVQAKIRQQLQVLREFGFIEFVDNNGTYRKRWREK